MPKLYAVCKTAKFGFARGCWLSMAPVKLQITATLRTSNVSGEWVWLVARCKEFGIETK